MQRIAILLLKNQFINYDVFQFNYQIGQISCSRLYVKLKLYIVHLKYVIINLLTNIAVLSSTSVFSVETLILYS